MFEKGKRHPNQGGKRGGGRPKKQTVANEALAMELAKAWLAKNFGELLDHAKKLIKGVRRRKFYPKEHKWAGRVYYEIEYDSATLRFLLERYLPPAKVSMDINLKSGFEALIKELEAEELLEKQRIEAARDVTREWEEAEDPPDDKPDPKKMH